ncbi:cell division protein Fic [Candidatus Magnetomorum sp. HK-1]|nr:cell division protein Fic [Candidatus Magnetomorum sp. HK-1]
MMKTDQKWIWQQGDWPNFYYDIKALTSGMNDVSRLIGALEVMAQSLTEKDLLKASEKILSDDAIETSAIEGEILKRSSVRSSMRKKLGLPQKTYSSDHKTDSLVSMLLDTRENAYRYLSEDILMRWHAALFPTGYSGLHKIRVGEYRGEEAMRIISGPIGKEKVHYIAPPKKNLNKEMELFFDWINHDDQTPPILKAGIAHLWLVMIHPFDDGNGRICRAVSDYVLSKAFPLLVRIFSISSEIHKNQKAYYAILEQMGKNSVDITDWLKWFIQMLFNALKESQWVINQVFQKTLFWNKFKDIQLNSRQKKALNRLLDAGDQFIGGLTTRKYAGICKCSKVTASRDLSDMEKKKLIYKRPGSGRSTSYAISVL